MDRTKEFRGRILTANNYTDEDKKAVEALKNGGTVTPPAAETYTKSEVDALLKAITDRVTALETA